MPRRGQSKPVSPDISGTTTRCPEADRTLSTRDGRRATGDGLDGRSEVHVSRFQVAGSRWPVRVAVSLSMSESVRYILLSCVLRSGQVQASQVSGFGEFLFYSVPVVVRLGLYGTLVQIYIYYGTPTLNTFQSWWRRSCPRHLRASHFPQPAHIDP